MGKDSDKSDAVSNGSEPDNTFIILQTIGDTTWRMFIPSVGFTLLGVWLDKTFSTKPWLMVGGIIIGALGATLLVREQIKRLKRGTK